MPLHYHSEISIQVSEGVLPPLHVPLVWLGRPDVVSLREGRALHQLALVALDD